METNQIYGIVNDIYSQMSGKEELTVVDTTSLISLGNTILNSQDNTEGFLNTLVQRIGKTILSYRKYSNSFKEMVLNDFEYGAIVQKIKVKMPTATSDEAYNLEDGVSVDMYVVSKPKVTQKFFVTRTPYSFYVTVQEELLKEAFTSETAMGSFISLIYGEMQNKLELTLENLGRLALANFIANAGDTQIFDLVTMYNNDTGNSIAPGILATNNDDFMRYAMGVFDEMTEMLTTMSSAYNKEGEDRHTPIGDQKFAVALKFQSRLKTVVQWQAFNERYVSKTPTTLVPYWQNSQSPLSIAIETEDGEVELDNVVACIYDKEALGIYKQEHMVRTTPLNARGLYMNTYHHSKQLWFNDLSENGIVFTLN